jgi:hypothetical protein
VAIRTTGQIIVLMPSATNFVLLANDNIVNNMRLRQDPDFEVPSLYKRARLIVDGTDEIVITRRQA